ncbi:MAG: PfkB family carbohydrate kinase [Solirubrobacteraceae bacterium]|nr:PfkB family carbohydrate kinase [Solirubrobacteraceae bacterium]
MGRVVVFGPHPLLSVTIEARGGEDDVHVHAAGQGVWLGRMAAELGAEVTLHGFCGGETGAVLEGLLARLPFTVRLTPTAGPSGCYVVDRRSGERVLVAQETAPPPSRHELDALVSAAIADALGADVLAIGNAFPGDQLPEAVYGEIAADVRAAGVTVIADLSSPRLEPVLPAGPDLVKLNDWELAGFVQGPVDPPERLLAAARRLRDGGARSVLVTRGGEPALWLEPDGTPRWVVPPALEHGMREGCGDSMMGAIAAALAAGRPLAEAVVTGAGAGAANFLHAGLGTGDRATVERLAALVRVADYPGA